MPWSFCCRVNPLSTTLLRSRWRDLGLVRFQFFNSFPRWVTWTPRSSTSQPTSAISALCLFHFVFSLIYLFPSLFSFIWLAFVYVYLLSKNPRMLWTQIIFIEVKEIQNSFTEMSLPLQSRNSQTIYWRTFLIIVFL